MNTNPTGKLYRCNAPTAKYDVEFHATGCAHTRSTHYRAPHVDIVCTVPVTTTTSVWDEYNGELECGEPIAVFPCTGLVTQVQELTDRPV
ncbi:hypothetical protein GSY69_10965 [Brevibacterium sp. 5221]|uniref:Uncharacterized protein n=1 Tax=Brevibacterium rongguiense TaxID=2695267 RepID=A0A6N9H8Q6_9MICO|nr:hypothetical protein [Brevibacterium rongguiense]MYM20470.1 hypothetical protein [Brevibacterium rongguiense]